MLGVWPPMAASGLQELLELIYVPNAVVHLLNGKVITWAVRDFIVDWLKCDICLGADHGVGSCPFREEGDLKHLLEGDQEETKVKGQASDRDAQDLMRINAPFWIAPSGMYVQGAMANTQL